MFRRGFLCLHPSRAEAVHQPSCDRFGQLISSRRQGLDILEEVDMSSCRVLVRFTFN